MCGKDNLGDVELSFASRTEEKMQEVFHAMQSSSTKVAQDLSKKWSLHCVPVSACSI